MGQLESLLIKDHVFCNTFGEDLIPNCPKNKKKVQICSESKPEVNTVVFIFINNDVQNSNCEGKLRTNAWLEPKTLNI